MMVEDIIRDLMRQQAEARDEKIKTAFEKHFGFSIGLADPAQMELIFVENNPVRSFRYRGETFLYWKEGEVEFKGDEAIITEYFREV